MNVLDRLSVICFAGTYGLAFLAELVRFFVGIAIRWYIATVLMALGWLVQTMFLANLALKNPVVLVTTAFESVMVLSWIVALIGLYLMVHSPKPVAVGIFVLPLVLGLVAAGWFAPRQSAWLEWGGTIAFWGTIHGIFLLAGAVFTCVAFFAGLMYLVQMRRLKAKRASRIGLALPSLEQSERINRGAITIAFPLLTFGLLIGIILSAAPRPSGSEAIGAYAALDRSEGIECSSYVAGFRRSTPCPVPASNSRKECCAANYCGFRVLGLYLGRCRGTSATYCPRLTPNYDSREDKDPVRLLALGVDHRSAPASVREALAFEGLQYSTGLNLLTQTFPGTEWIILSTCNRVEVYVAGSSNQLPKISELVDILANIHSISSETFAEHLDQLP